MTATYLVTIEVQTKKRLTAKQQDTMREEIIFVIDDYANLPLDADVVSSSVKEER